MVESFKALEMEKGEQYFQQDNDSKHTSKHVKKWFKLRAKKGILDSKFEKTCLKM